MPPKIAIYNNGRGTTGSLIPSLRTSFNGFALETVKPAHLDAGILQNRNTKIFILPGIAGEDSPYPDELTPGRLESISRFVQEGGVMLAICAGSYFFAQKTFYTPAWGPHKTRISTLPIFNGMARGPVGPSAKGPQPEPRFGHVTIVPVSYQTRDGTWQDTGVCYGNGPGLYPNDINDPNLDILARFKTGNQNTQPAALLKIRRGNGTVYLSSILPEIAHSILRDIPGLESARKLMNDLAPYEDGRRDLWETLANRILLDVKATP